MRKLHLRKTKDVKPGACDSEPMFFDLHTKPHYHMLAWFSEKAKVLIAIVEIKMYTVLILQTY